MCTKYIFNLRYFHIRCENGCNTHKSRIFWVVFGFHKEHLLSAHWWVRKVPEKTQGASSMKTWIAHTGHILGNLEVPQGSLQKGTYQMETVSSPILTLSEWSLF